MQASSGAHADTAARAELKHKDQEYQRRQEDESVTNDPVEIVEGIKDLWFSKR
jgi:hypothetical protein